MVMLISFVNNLAPGTAIDMDIHFPASLCKSVRETWLELNIDSIRAVNFSFLLKRRRKACKRESHSSQGKEPLGMAVGWISGAQYSSPI